MAANWLVFIDTNILLDFYRLRGASALNQLSFISGNRDKIILTEQIQMEYLKHRQRVVSETLKEIKKPVEQKLPPFLANYQAGQSLSKLQSESTAQYKRVLEKAKKILTNPDSHDEVYKALRGVFSKRSEYYLDRDHSEKLKIRSLARKRFLLGYPPRKQNDSSMGDALNWEWVIHCAINCPDKSNIIIVSRDGDYGSASEKSSYLNDWLKKEFKERVSRRRSVVLTELLTEAFKKINIEVSRDEIEEERQVARSSQSLQLHISPDIVKIARALQQSRVSDTDMQRLSRVSEIIRHYASNIESSTLLKDDD